MEKGRKRYAGTMLTWNIDRQFNTGSPYNVPAGSQADISKVVEHYEKINYEENAKKLEALKNGTLKAEQPPSKLGSGRAPTFVPPSAL